MLITLTLGQFLIGSVILLFLGAFCMAWMFRHVFILNRKQFQDYKNKLKEKAEKLKLTTQVIQDIIYETNHYYENPLLKRLRGLINTLQRLRKSIKENLMLIKKPTDYLYAKIALKDWEEIDHTLEIMVKVAIEMEEGILERAKRVEEL